MNRVALLIILCATVATAQQYHQASFAPIAAITSYKIDGTVIVGPTVGMHVQSPEYSSVRYGVFASVTFRPNGYEASPVEQAEARDNSLPSWVPQPPGNLGTMRHQRFDFGLATIGFDLTMYLADGELRPYVGIGAQSVSWMVNQTLTGAVVPEARAGVDVHLTRGFAAFGEVRHSIGFPTLYGNTLSRIDGITSAAFGVSFGPRW